MNPINSYLAINESAAGFFAGRLYEGTEAAKNALDYLHKRNINDDLIAKYRLGYCPAHPYDSFTQHALKQNQNLEALRHLGLTQYSRITLKLYDRFHGRVMFPKWNESGQLVGFGGRLTGPLSYFEAKYIQSAQTEIYDMLKIVYGLHWAAESIVKKGWALVVEGYMDVIRLREEGFTNVISPIGIFLTQEHLSRIQPYTNRIALMLDGDRPGIEAMVRLQHQLNKSGWDNVVVPLTGGEDPDSFVLKSGSQPLQDLLDEHIPEHWHKK